MPDLLLELLTEEIPARLQAGAAEDLKRLATEKLAAAGLAHGDVASFVGPRRLALAVADLPAAKPASSEERRGPRVGAPAAALEGFLKSAGLASIAECEERDTGKGIFYFARIDKPGRAAEAVLPGLLREAILALPWAKSMRFPAARFRWVRPLESVVALFDGKPLALELDGVPVGTTTRGHRFLADGRFAVTGLADYRAKLGAAHVVLDAAERKASIAAQLERAAAALQLRLRPDVALLDEVTGLVEWPVVLAGRIDAAFMDLPPEVLITSMRAHQKYFACLDAAGKLAPHFLLVSNMATADRGQAIVAGNERVLRARLADARFFWDQDRKAALASRVPKLAERVFHAKLGSMLDKSRRVVRLAAALVPYIPGADATSVERAAMLAKADLSAGMVGEFPELQGVMGRYYAANDGEAPAVAAAIAEHYAPQGPNDRCPTAPVSVAVALADKLDTLVGFFAIGETPTGSKDPFALRRAALGAIRIVLENGLRLPLLTVFAAAHTGGAGADPAPALLAFFADRLKVHLRERGMRHDLIAAAFGRGGEDDLVRLMQRVDALAGFLSTAQGGRLLTAYRRASNIVRIEEKKDQKSYADAPQTALFQTDEELGLHRQLLAISGFVPPALRDGNFQAAMAYLATELADPVDAFFERVTVNSPEAPLRTNRLRLLARIRDTLDQVADFSAIEG